MLQILQSYRSGELWLAEVPAPACLRNGIKVIASHSLISAGTEKRMVDLGKSSLLQKARKRPDQVKRVLQKIKTEGLKATYEQVQAKLDTPVPLGYSVAGTVVEVGVDARGFKVGDRVACAGVGYANHAEAVTVPHTLAVRLPDGVTTEQAAYTTLGAIAMQAVRQADVQIGEYVGVVGLGLLGNLAVQILSAAGCRVYGVDLDPSKIALAKACGAEGGGSDLIKGGLEFSGGRGLDCIIIAAGSKDSTIIRLCPAALRHRGRIVVLGFVGMDCPHQEFYEKELELRMSMSYGPGRYDPNFEEKGQDYPYPFVRWTEQRNMESFLALVARGRIDVDRLTTHRYPISDALQAYALMETHEPYMGILLSYPEVQGVDQRRTVSFEPQTAPRGDRAPAQSIALVGTGGFASGTVSPILKKLGVPVSWVVSGRGAPGVTAAKALGALNASTDLRECLADPSATHVIVANRHASHASTAQAALRAGKHVHVEKPMCVSRDELEALVELVDQEKAADRIHVGFNRRYSPLSGVLKTEVDKRPGAPLTIIYRVNAGVLTPGHWFYDDPGGRITAEGCHFIDYCLFLVGQPIAELHCVAKSTRDTPFDSFTVSLRFADGSMGTVVYAGDGDRSLPKEHIEVFRGGSCWINSDWSSLVRHEGGKRVVLYKGRQNKGWHEEFAHFAGQERCAHAGLDWPSIVRSHEAMFNAIDSAVHASGAGDEA